MSQRQTGALAMQGRVLWALCLREIHGKHGKSRLGYLWQLIKTGFGVGVFWIIREKANFHAPQGLSTPVFLLMGFIPWFIFSESLKMVMEAVRTNKALLTFPQITPLDLCLSSSIVVAATETVVLAIYMVALLLVGYDVPLYSPLIFLGGLLGVSLLGFGTGLTLASLTLYLPVLEKLVPMVMRILFFVSGVFFSPSQMAGKFGDAIMWIPITNYIELLRGSFVGTAPSDMVKVEYTIGVTTVLLVVGLLLERYSRPKQELV